MIGLVVGVGFKAPICSFSNEGVGSDKLAIFPEEEVFLVGLAYASCVGVALGRNNASGVTMVFGLIFCRLELIVKLAVFVVEVPPDGGFG